MALATSKTSIMKDYLALNVTITAAPKTGKTTFASKLGLPGEVYFASTEVGYNFLEIYKTDINKWEDFASLCHDLLTTKHGFRHLVIDVVDKLHEYASEYVCTINKVKTISDLPYGSGYTAVKKLMMNQFDALNKKNIGITFITHEKIREIAKDSVKWSAVCTSLQASIENAILGMCDILIYGYISKEGHRTIRLKPTKYIQCAGDRSNKLPETMPMDPVLLMEKLRV